MSFFDYVAIAFYIVFMLSLGRAYKRFSSTASDFFRGGGTMLWWVVGSSSFMTTFSAWSFTGGAARVYETGTYFLVIFAGNLAALVVTYFLTAARFRQMRIITAIEGVQKRYGNLNEQVFTWLPLVFRILAGGITLYAVAIFMHGVFKVDIGTIIIVLGVTATVMTLLGGSWAATAGDFLQMLVVLSITFIMALLSLWHPEIGGPAQFVQKLPEFHFDWTTFSRPSVIVFFIVALFINQGIQMNSMLEGGSKYVFVKNGAEARKAALLTAACFVVIAPIWIIPPMAATIVFPDLGVQFPTLNNPNEASYVAMTMDLLPKGLLGVMVCAIFAASMTSLNSWLNTISGTFVRNFWIRKVDPNASDTKQILVGRLCILVYGCLWVTTALIFKDIQGLKLFDLVLIAAVSIGIPTAVPLFFGMFIKETPPWSAWSTVVVGSIVAVSIRAILNADSISAFFDPVVPFNSQELADLNIGLTTSILTVVCVSWYFMSMLFYRHQGSEYEENVEVFFEEINRPVETDRRPEAVAALRESDSMQAQTLGKLCFSYGIFITFLILVPNSSIGRFCIVGCGAFLILVGSIIIRVGRKSAVEGVANIT